MPILILGIRAYKQDNYLHLECDGSCNPLSIAHLGEMGEEGFGMRDGGWGIGDGEWGIGMSMGLGLGEGLGGTESLLKWMDQHSRRPCTN